MYAHALFLACLNKVSISIYCMEDLSGVFCVRVGPGGDGAQTLGGPWTRRVCGVWRTELSLLQIYVVQ